MKEADSPMRRHETGVVTGKGKEARARRAHQARERRPGRSRRAVPLLPLIAVLAALAIQAPGPAFAGNEPIRKVLPNGLTVVLQENREAPVVSIQVWVKAGSAEETDEQAGVAHVHEHMLFKGTKTRGVGEIAREVEAAGGEINAYTSWEMTVYYINMAARFMDTGIDILADIMQNAAFDPKELQRELEVIQEEIRRGKDMPSRRLSEAFFAEAYKVHPYGRPVIGFEKTVRGFDRQDVLRFYRSWYVPENLVWVMVGDFDAETLMPRLAERLSRMPKAFTPVRVKTVEPPQTSPRVFINREDVKETQLRIGFHIPGITDPDVPALDLLAQILGAGRSSRLYRSLRMEERVVNSVSAYSMTPKDPGLFILGASLESDDLDQALDGLLDISFGTRVDPVDTEELEKAKAQIESDFIYQMETVQGQARELGYYEAIVGDLDFGRKYLERIRSVGPEDVLRVARKYLRPDQMTLGLLVPTDSDKGLTDKKLLKHVAAAFGKTERRLARQEERSRKTAQEVHKSRLSNGATLLVKQNPSVPLVSCRAVFLGGLLFEGAHTNGISNFVAQMLDKGTATRTAEQIAHEVESLAGSISGFSGRDSLGLTAETVSWNFRPVFEVFSDVLVHPSFPEEYIEKTRQDILAAIKNQEDDLAHTAFHLFWKTVYPNHPYGMDVLGTPETVGAFTRDDLVAFYGRQAVGGNLVLAVVGDVDPEEVRQAAEAALADLPAQTLAVPEQKAGPPSKAVALKTVSPEKMQAHIVLGARGARHTDPDRYSLEVLDAVLSGQGGRLFLTLRDKESLAYTVTAFSRDAYDPGVFGVYIASQPDKRERAVEGIREQLARVRSEKVSREEMERAKNYLIGSYEIGLQSNSAQASTLAFNERYGLGYDEYLRYAENIEAVTPKKVRKAARKYLCEECLEEAAVIPGEKDKP